MPAENKLGLPASARMQYGSRGYCTYLHDKDAAVVADAEAAPSVHSLLEAWLERTPFLAIGTFNWWRYYETSVTHMLDEDERAIRANPHLHPDLIEQQIRELAVQREHFASLFDESKYETSRKKGDRRFSYRAMQAVRSFLIT
jgi:tryptophan 2,3-dioxygenase